MRGLTERAALHQWHVLVVGTLVISLFATVTNLVPLSIAFCWLAPFLPFFVLRQDIMPRVVLSLLCLYAYFMVSVLAYAPESLLEPEFFRRDGNVFVTFLPILIGGVLCVAVDIQAIVRAFLNWVTLVNAAFVGVFIFTGGTIFVSEPGVYHLLFEAHNAAGGYLASITALAIAQYACARNWRTALVVAVNGCALFMTVSRGSVLGLIGALIVVMVLKNRGSKLALWLGAAMVAVTLYFSYPVWVTSGMPASWAELSGDPAKADVGASDANVLDRVLLLWPRAWYLFRNSPIFGTGFGSYDDLPYHLEGVPGLLMLNRPDHLTFSSAHAHNTYLHVMAETGLVGLLLLAWFLRELRTEISLIRDQPVRLGLLLTLWTAIFSSLTEHRLFTPAQMLPMTILLGLAMSCTRADRRLSVAGDFIGGDRGDMAEEAVG